MKKRSIKINAILNMTRTLLGIIFPLITFPYISRVLGVDNIGKINFSSSIISYFTLIAAFGVSTYAIREGAKIRDKKEEFYAFANQVFTINVVTSAIAYILLFVLLLISRQLHNYSLIIAIQCTSIFFATLGNDWINNIYEDFVYTTIRGLIFQIISLILMFVLVHDSSDYYIYTAITVLASAGGNISNYFYCKRYAKVRLTFKVEYRKHLPSMVMFFFSNITTIIFLNSDQTMLGVMCGDYNVGLYSVSVKIYSIVKSVFTSILTVALPRMIYMTSNVAKRDADDFRNNILIVFLTLVCPLAVGLFILSDAAIAIVGGPEYMDAVISLRILSVSVLCSAAASFMTYLVILPQNKEKIMVRASTISACTNVLLNLVFIRILAQNGAALTTAISEAIVFFVEFKGVSVYFDSQKIIKNLFQVTLGCAGIVLVNVLARKIISNLIVSSIITVPISIIVYFFVLLVCRNALAHYFMNWFKNQISKQ